VRSFVSVCASIDLSATASGTKADRGTVNFSLTVLVIGFLGRASEQHWRRELETRHRARGLLPLSGVVSAALPAQVRVSQSRLFRGRPPSVITMAFLALRPSCRGSAPRTSRDLVNGDVCRRGTEGQRVPLRWIGRSFSPSPRGIARSGSPGVSPATGVSSVSGPTHFRDGG
jgi:hypothetical protein